MEYKRHIILDSPKRKAHVQIMVVWVGESPEIFEPKGNRTANDMVKTFVRVLQNDGCKIISDKCA
jgi:hypothetical protein